MEERTALTRVSMSDASDTPLWGSNIIHPGSSGMFTSPKATERVVHFSPEAIAHAGVLSPL